MSVHRRRRSATATSWAGVALTVILIWPGHVAAQLAGVPVWPVGIPNPRAPLHLIAGGHATSGGDFVGPGTGADWGVTAAVEYLAGERFTLRGGAGFLERDVTRTDRAIKPQFFVLGGVNLLQTILDDGEGGVSVVGGYGYGALGSGSSEQSLMLGLDLTGGIGFPGLFLWPSVVPRWSWRRTEVGGNGDWQDGFGMSVGLTFGFPAGLRLEVGGDRTFLGDGDADPPGLLAPRTYSWYAGIRWAL